MRDEPDNFSALIDGIDGQFFRRQIFSRIR